MEPGPRHRAIVTGVSSKFTAALAGERVGAVPKGVSLNSLRADSSTQALLGIQGGAAPDNVRIALHGSAVVGENHVTVAPSNPHRLKAFIVEDSPLLRDQITDALEELAQVEVVGSAPDEMHALQWLAAYGDNCDLLVLDIFLKTGSGLGVLRALPERRPAHIVILSNYATPEIRERCLELGADRVFDKSTEIETLVAYCQTLPVPNPDALPGADAS